MTNEVTREDLEDLGQLSCDMGDSMREAFRIRAAQTASRSWAALRPDSFALGVVPAVAGIALLLGRRER